MPRGKIAAFRDETGFGKRQIAKLIGAGICWSNAVTG